MALNARMQGSVVNNHISWEGEWRTQYILKKISKEVVFNCYLKDLNGK